MKLFTEYRGLRRELYVLFIGRIMTNLGAMIWPMFTLILNRKLGLNATTIAAAMMAYSILSIPVSIIGGSLADRCNKRNIIIICDLISIAAYIYCSMVPVSISSVIVFSTAALFQSAEWPSYDALVADFTVSADRERAYSLSYLGGNLGLVLAPTLGGLLFNEHLNLAFLINGLSIASSTLLIFLLIKDIHREEDDSAAGVYEKAVDSRVSSLSYIAKNRVIFLYLIVYILMSSVYDIWGYLMPIDLTARHGDIGSVLFGTMNSVNCMIVVALTALITRVFKRLRDIDKMFAGEVLILAGYALFAVLSGKTVFCYVSIAIFTLGEIFSTISSSPFLTRRIPSSHRGRIIAVSGIFANVMMSLVQLLVGRIYDTGGPGRAWMTVLAFGAAALVLIRIMRRLDVKDYSGLYSSDAERDNELDEQAQM